MMVPFLQLLLCAAAFCSHYAAGLPNGILLPAMGLSTWNKFGGGVSDALVRELADAMNSSGLLAAGYTYLNLDDGRVKGWHKSVCATG